MYEKDTPVLSRRNFLAFHFPEAGFERGLLQIHFSQTAASILNSPTPRIWTATCHDHSCFEFICPFRTKRGIKKTHQTCILSCVGEGLPCWA